MEPIQSAVFSEPSILLINAFPPNAAFSTPFVFAGSVLNQNAELYCDNELFCNEWYHIDVTVLSLPLDPRQTVTPFTTISHPVNVAICPLAFIVERILAFSTPFVFITRSCASVVPTKFVPAEVPPFPVTSHEFDEAAAATHDATPLASEVRIFPTPCVPSMIWIVPPEIVSLAHGVLVPIPTAPLAMPVVPMPLP